MPRTGSEPDVAVVAQGHAPHVVRRQAILSGVGSPLSVWSPTAGTARRGDPYRAVRHDGDGVDTLVGQTVRQCLACPRAGGGQMIQPVVGCAGPDVAVDANRDGSHSRRGPCAPLAQRRATRQAAFGSHPHVANRVELDVVAAIVTGQAIAAGERPPVPFRRHLADTTRRGEPAIAVLVEGHVVDAVVGQAVQGGVLGVNARLQVPLHDTAVGGGPQLVRRLVERHGLDVDAAGVVFPSVFARRRDRGGHGRWRGGPQCRGDNHCRRYGHGLDSIGAVHCSLLFAVLVVSPLRCSIRPAIPGQTFPTGTATEPAFAQRS